MFIKRREDGGIRGGKVHNQGCIKRGQSANCACFQKKDDEFHEKKWGRGGGMRQDSGDEKFAYKGCNHLPMGDFRTKNEHLRREGIFVATWCQQTQTKGGGEIGSS